MTHNRNVFDIVMAEIFRNFRWHQSRNMTKRLSILSAAGAITLSLAFCGTASGQSSDALIDKLVEKGILTVKEATELREEADKGFTQAHAAKSGLPDWVSSLKLNGDFRARYDGIYSDIPGLVDRHRARLRLRFGATASLTDDIEVGFRLASAASTGGDNGGDPISTNETLGNNGNRKAIGLDLAYAKWSPVQTPEWNGSFTFGKFENPFSFSEMLFDNDYTPEGFAEQFSFNPDNRQSLKLNFGQFVLDESSSSSRDAYMLGGQVRLDSTWNEKWQSTMSLAGLSILNPRSLTSGAVPNVGRGNTRTAAGVLLNDYNLVIADAAIVHNFGGAPFYEGAFPVRLGVEYIHNFGASEKNRAYGFGPTFGKAGKKGTWEFSIKYKELQADSVYEETVDSDYGAVYAGRPVYEPVGGSFPAYHSGVNIRGPVFRFSYSPRDFLTFSAMYAYAHLIDEVPLGSDSDGGHLVIDGVFKF